MKRGRNRLFSRFKRNIRNKLLTGLLIILPIYVTIFVIKFLFKVIGGELLPIIKRLFKHDLQLPEQIINPLLVTVGIFATFVALYFIGMFASNFLGKWIIAFYERIISNTPVVKNIYSSSKQVIKTFSSSPKSSFKRVVIVEYPRREMNVVGFVTGSIVNKSGLKLTSIFIPTTPNPTSGFLVFLKDSEIAESNMSVEEAIKLVVSAGILVPDNLDFKIKGDSEIIKEIS